MPLNWRQQENFISVPKYAMTPHTLSSKYVHFWWEQLSTFIFFPPLKRYGWKRSSSLVKCFLPALNFDVPSHPPIMLLRIFNYSVLYCISWLITCFMNFFSKTDRFCNSDFPNLNTVQKKFANLVICTPLVEFYSLSHILCVQLAVVSPVSACCLRASLFLW